MKRIWKYMLTLTDYPVISMQKGARVLSVGVQHGKIQVWALVDPEAPKELRRFRVAGTGHTLLEEEFVNLRFIGTVQIDPLVWHIFEYQEEL